jgi:transcriptional regulator with XRE-family HTH domain
VTAADTVTGRRRELGAFLKARRARVAPEDVGLPPGTRRRTAGLRREEVALLAGVGVTWYTWLEQGRPINASAQVLDAVARTLRLDLAERRHLYQLAEATPSRGWAPASTVPEPIHVLLRSLDPLPATLINGRFDIFASNDAHKTLFHDWHTSPCVHMNLLWCCVTEPTARQHIEDYDGEIEYMVARMRADYAGHVGDPDWEEDIRRLLDINAEFAALWARHEVIEPRMRTRVFTMAPFGRLTFAVHELNVAASPGLRIQVNTPEDTATWSVVDRLLDGPPVPASAIR